MSQKLTEWSSSIFNPYHVLLQMTSYPSCLWLSACVHLEGMCALSRSMEMGLFCCQLQSALTCARNVVYCPNASPKEHLRRPLKFKAIYHHPLPPPPPPHMCLPSSPLSPASFSPPCHNLLLPFSSFQPLPSICIRHVILSLPSLFNKN